MEPPVQSVIASLAPLPVPPESIREELQRILASGLFSHAPRLSRFLRFTAERALEGQGEQLNQYLIGVEVFDRSVAYDPITDPIVRVEASRLRAKLQQYYQSEGRLDRVLVKYDKGTYAPTFQLREIPGTGQRRLWTRTGAGWRWKAVLFPIALVLVAVIIYWGVALGPGRVYFHRGGPASESMRGGDLATPSPAPVPSVAVFSFDDLGPGSERQRLGASLAEAVTSKLRQATGGQVIALPAMSASKAERGDVRSLGEKHHVDALVDGKVTQNKGRWTITARLVRVRDGLELWSESYEREGKADTALQNEISESIVNVLKALLLGTGNPNRYPWGYGLSMPSFWGQTASNQAPATPADKLKFYADNVGAPNNVSPYMRLADSFFLLGIEGFMPWKDAMQQADAAVKKALAYDNTSAEAHTLLGVIRSSYYWDWPGAEQEFKRALELNPRHVFAHQAYAQMCLAATGRLDEAILEIKRALELDPQVSFTHAILGSLLYANGQYDQSIEACRQALELDPNCYWAYLYMGLSFERKGMYAEAIAELEKADALSGGDSAILGSLGYVYAVSGRKGEARKLLEQLQKRAERTYVIPIHIAWVYAGLGDKDRVFQWLDKAYADRSNWLNSVKIDPIFVSVRTDSRFTALLKKMGLQN